MHRTPTTPHSARRRASVAAVLLCCWALLGATSDSNEVFAGRPDVEAFIGNMVKKHSFRHDELENLFSQAHAQPRIIKAMSAPIAKPRPWYKYRANFINSTRINGGERFWQSNAPYLRQARQQYGVPEEVITSIIGVETRYGAVKGSTRVLDALATLAFDYPRRADFFRDELENFLLLTRDEKIDPLTLRGSYAGAMGLPQFMPGSFRRFAVDFDGDGHRDLWNNEVDAIGSVANYLQTYGWRANEPIAVPASVSGEQYKPILDEGIKPRLTVDELKKLGITPDSAVPGNLPAALIVVEEEDGMHYWLAFNNFYVITRYNRSVNYAMAVFLLSREVATAHQQMAGAAPAQKLASRK